MAEPKAIQGVVKLPDGTFKPVRATNEEVAFARELAKQEVAGKKRNLTKALLAATGGKPSRAMRDKAHELGKHEVVTVLKDNMTREFQHALLAECEVEEYAKEVVSSFKSERGSKKVPGLILYGDIMRVRSGVNPGGESAAKHIYNTINFYSNEKD